MAVYLDIPQRVGRPEDFTQTESTEALYDREIEKANTYSENITTTLYIGSLYTHILSIPIRLFSMPIQFIQTLFALEYFGSSFELVTGENSQRQLEHLISENGEDHESVVRQRKFMRVMEKMQRLARSINVEVDFYYKSEVELAAAYSKSIYFGAQILHMDEDEMEAVLAHEIQHIAGKHVLKIIAFHIAELSVDVFLLFVFPFGILLFETAAFFINSYVQKRFERQADFGAMDLLGTNEGMTTLWKREIELGGGRYVPSSIQIPIYRREGLTEEQMFEIRKAKIPSESTHPWLSERYDYCRDYTPLTLDSTVASSA